MIIRKVRMGNRILFWNSFNTLECKVFNRLTAYVPMALAKQTTYGILSHSILSSEVYYMRHFVL